MNNITPEIIITTAKKWIGTPFHPQGRKMGAGVDCLGLVIGVAKQLNIQSLQGGALINYDQSIYNIDAPNATVLLRHLEAHLLPANGIIKPGYVLSCISAKQRIHLGIISGPSSFIHACMLHGKVVEERIPTSQKNKAWIFPE